MAAGGVAVITLAPAWRVSSAEWTHGPIASRPSSHITSGQATHGTLRDRRRSWSSAAVTTQGRDPELGRPDQRHRQASPRSPSTGTASQQVTVRHGTNDVPVLGWRAHRRASAKTMARRESRHHPQHQRRVSIADVDQGNRALRPRPAHGQRTTTAPHVTRRRQLS